MQSQKFNIKYEKEQKNLMKKITEIMLNEEQKQL